jgi:hypothetical protein
MALATGALTTFESVSNMLLRSDAEDKLASEVFQSGGDFEKEGERAIGDASKQVTTYLSRDLIVKKYLILTKRGDWEDVDRTPDSDYNFRLVLHRVREWPVLAVEEDVKIHMERFLFAKSRLSDNLNVYGGYRRDDQSLSDLSQDVQDQFSQDSDVPVLPEDIVGVVNRLSVYYAKVSIKGLIGISEETQNIGQNLRTTVEKTERDKEYVKEELRKLQDYRLIA